MWLKDVAIVCGCGLLAVSFAADGREAFINEYLQQTEMTTSEQITPKIEQAKLTNNKAAPEDALELPGSSEFAVNTDDEEEIVAEPAAGVANEQLANSTTVDHQVPASTIALPTVVKHNMNHDQAVAELQLRIAQIEDRVAKLEKEQLRTQPFVCTGNGTVCKVINMLRERMGVRNFVWMIATIMIVLFALLVYLITSYNRTSVISIANYPQAPEHSGESPASSLEPVEGNEENHAAALNLARAYIDMGKLDGAKELLETVLRLGNEREQADAKKLLAKLDAEKDGE